MNVKMLVLFTICMFSSMTLVADNKQLLYNNDQHGSSYSQATASVANHIKLRREIDRLKASSFVLDKEIDVLNEKLEKLNNKNIELEIWIELQRGLSYSRDHFRQKTNKSLKSIKANKILAGVIKDQLKQCYNRQEAIKNRLKTVTAQYINLERTLATSFSVAF